MTAEDDVVRAADPGEPHTGASAGKLNWLRAGVLGANDGIVSVASIVVGVAGATSSRGPPDLRGRRQRRELLADPVGLGGS